MAQNLNINNFDSPNILAQTTLTQDIAASVSSLPVANSGDFSSGGPVAIGNLGAGTVELLTVTPPSNATSVPLSSNTALPHSFNDSVTLLFGNQIRIYRANDVYGTGTQPPDANFSLIATITIDPRRSQTRYVDASGIPGQWYKSTYYSPTSQSETQLSDSRAAQSGVVHYVSPDQVRAAAGFSNNPNVTDDIVTEKRDAAEREVNGALQGVYDLPLPQPTNPIIVEIVKNIAGGELMAEMYTGVSAEKVAEGEAKAAKGRVGSELDNTAGIAQLVDRSVVLLDANYIEEVRDEAHGFGGYPDETTATLPRSMGGDGGNHFRVNKVY